MPEIPDSPDLVAYCGLYCGACGSFRKGRCPGCHGNENASWCGVRRCCREHGWASCASCTLHADPMACKLFNNFMSKLFSFVFRSDRAACIRQIRAVGIEAYATKMAATGRQSIRRGKSAA